jgi:hypothetical protein
MHTKLAHITSDLITQWNLLEPEVGVSSKYEHLKIATPLSDSGYIRTPAFMQEPERREGTHVVPARHFVV